jgi:hypothetical protein
MRKLFDFFLFLFELLHDLDNDFEVADYTSSSGRSRGLLIDAVPTIVDELGDLL